MSIVDKRLTYHESGWLMDKLREEQNPVGNLFTRTHFVKFSVSDVLTELKKAGWKSANEDLVLRYIRRVLK